MPRPARHSQSVQAAVKMEKAEIWGVAALSERLAGWQYLRHKFIGAMPSALSLRGPNGAVAISQYPAGSQGTPGEYGNFTRRGVEDAAPYNGGCRTRVPSRDCHVGLRPPRNDKPLAFIVLSIACTGRQHCAGSGMPLPYNGVYNCREYPEICSCQWRSLTAATDAIGFYFFIGTLYELEVPSRDCHVASLLAMTIRKCIPF